MMPTIPKTTCYSCGRELEAGYALYGSGAVDPETGYQDLEIICSDCADKD